MSYFCYLFDYTDAALATLAHHVRNPVFGRVDFLTGIGLSGTLPLLQLGRMTGLPIYPLRKKGTSSHGGASWSPRQRGLRYLIIDDFVSTGQTIHCVIDEMTSRESKPECAGVLCYQDQHRKINFDEPWVYSSLITGTVGVGLSDEIVEVDALLKKGYRL